MATKNKKLDEELIVKSINYHGHGLLKNFTKEQPDELGSMKLSNIDYRVQQARIPEIKLVI